jgi:predicted acylesterase/phospholipase RssA
VLKALLAGKSPTTGYQPLNPEVFTGTSVGSYNAAFLTSAWRTQGPAANSDLEQIWLSQISEVPRGCGNGAFRIRGLDPFNPFCYLPNPFKPMVQLAGDSVSLTGDLLQRSINLLTGQGTMLERGVNLLNMSSFISNDPLRQLIDHTINFAEIRKSDKKLVIIATNWIRGSSELFRNPDMSDQLGPDIIMASTAIPGVFPIHRVGAYSYVDGGVLLNTPLQPAIEAGANVLHVITLNPNVEHIALAEMSNTLETAYRQQVIGWVKAVEQNLVKIWAYNRTLELANLTRDLAEHLHIDADQMSLNLDLSDEIHHLLQGQSGNGTKRLNLQEALPEGGTYNLAEQLRAETQNYIPITVYLYRPNAALGGPLGLLDFSYERMLQLINRGFEDAVNFDETDQNYVPPYPIRYRLAKEQIEEARRRARVELFRRQTDAV